MPCPGHCGGQPPTCARSPTSSRHAQCSTIRSSSTRQMWMKSHPMASPVGGSPARSGIVEATWRPFIVRCTTTRSSSATTRWIVAVGRSRSCSSVARVSRRPSRPCGPAACWMRSAGVTGAARSSHASGMIGVRGAMPVRTPYMQYARSPPAVAAARRSTPDLSH